MSTLQAVTGMKLKKLKKLKNNNGLGCVTCDETKTVRVMVNTKNNTPRDVQELRVHSDVKKMVVLCVATNIFSFLCMRNQDM